LSFVRRGLNPADAPPDPAVANVRLIDFHGDGKLDVVAADMRYGLVMTGWPYADDAELKVIAQLDNPCHVSMVDFDKDGIQDFLVADLGQFLPGARHVAPLCCCAALPVGDTSNSRSKAGRAWRT
jgi:hypothetical protein